MFNVIKLSRCLRQTQIHCRKISTLENMNNLDVHISEEVLNSLKNNKPVVALESAIITHGMPYPTNLITAKEVENIVNKNGATAATVAILNGQIHVGLNDDQLKELATKQTNIVKVSRRDIPYVLSKGVYGGTTVSSTMLIAHRVGIPVFVTGGIGGVHRGAELSMDVSADLIELGRTPTMVISSGVKSILDIGLTLEYLETQGVCVVTYGNNTNFPAFFTSKSNFSSPYNVETPEEAAKLIDANHRLKLKCGILLAVPIPEKYAADGKQIENAINKAMKQVQDDGIFGKKVTPYILQKVNEETKGASLAANVALIKNNAKVGSQVAVALAEMRAKREGQTEKDPKKENCMTSNRDKTGEDPKRINQPRPQN